MEFDLLRCGYCKREYNLHQHLPRLLLACGHTICTACIVSLIQGRFEMFCPFDKTQYLILPDRGINTFPINPTLKQILEGRTEKEMCKQHDEEITFFCMNDRTKVCSVCIHEGRHKDHDLKSLKKIKEEFDNRNKKVNIILGDLGHFLNSADSILHESEAGALKDIEESYERVIQMITQKKVEIISRTRMFFDIQRQKLEEMKSNSLKKNIIGHIEELALKNNSGIDTRKLMELIEKTKAIFIEKQAQRSKILDNQSQDFKYYTEQCLQAVNRSFELQSQLLKTQETNIKDIIDKFGQLYINNSKEEDKKKLFNAIISKANKLITLSQNGDCILIAPKENTPENNEPQDLKLSLEKARNLEDFIIRLDNKTIMEDTVNALYLIWTTLNKVCSLKLDFIGEEIQDHDVVNILRATFWKVKDLKKFEINLDNSHVTDNTTVFFLFREVIPKLLNLKSLALNLRYTKISDRTIETLATTSLPLINSLENFQLTLCGTQITDESVVQMFGSMEKVVRLALDFDFTQITDISINAFTKVTLPTMHSLQEFELYLSNTQVTDVSISHLLQSVPPVGNFFLSLDQTAISDRSLEIFAGSSLQRMENLDRFVLSLRSTNVGDQGVKALLSQLKRTKKLGLYLGNTKITNDFMQVFHQNMFNVMENLQEFDISLIDTLVTDEGVIQMFRNMPYTKYFSLSLADTKISDRTLKAFVETTLKTMPNLEYLQLNVWRTQVTDEGVIELFKCIKNIKRLRIFLQGTTVTNRSVDILEKYILNNEIRGLESLEIALDNTGVTPRGIAKLDQIKSNLNI